MDQDQQIHGYHNRTAHELVDREATYKPEQNPLIIRITATLATIMEVFEMSIADVALFRGIARDLDSRRATDLSQRLVRTCTRNPLRWTARSFAIFTCLTQVKIMDYSPSCA
jgi:hypothetical protein